MELSKKLKASLITIFILSLVATFLFVYLGYGVIDLLNRPQDSEEALGTALGLILLLPLSFIVAVPTFGLGVAEIVLSSIAIVKYNNKKVVTILALIYSIVIVLIVILYALFFFVLN